MSDFDSEAWDEGRNSGYEEGWDSGREAGLDDARRAIIAFFAATHSNAEEIADKIIRPLLR